MSDIRTAAERIRAGADRARAAGFPKVAASVVDEAEHILTRFDELAEYADRLPGSLLHPETNPDTRPNPVVAVADSAPRSIYAPPPEYYK